MHQTRNISHQNSKVICFTIVPKFLNLVLVPHSQKDSKDNKDVKNDLNNYLHLKHKYKTFEC